MAKIQKNEQQLTAFKEIEGELKVLQRLDTVIREAAAGFQSSFSATDGSGKQLKYACPVSESTFKSFLRQQAKNMAYGIQNKASRNSIALDDKEEALCSAYSGGK